MQQHHDHNRHQAIASTSTIIITIAITIAIARTITIASTIVIDATTAITTATTIARWPTHSNAQEERTGAHSPMIRATTA